jgi:hypothetical protein
MPGKPGYRIQVIQIALEELQVGRRRAEEVATDIDTDTAGRAVSDQLSELAAVAAADVEY